MNHVESTNINDNKLNDVIENELKFDSSNSLTNDTVEDPRPMVTLSLIGGKNFRHNLNSVITYLWYSGSTYSMIRCNNINPSNSKLMANKVEYITASGPYKITHDVKVTLSIPKFSSRNFITRLFQIGSAQVNTGIGYDMIMTCSSPRRLLFLHALSFECSSKLCITFLNQFTVYFHIKKMHNTI